MAALRPAVRRLPLSSFLTSSSSSAVSTPISAASAISSSSMSTVCSAANQSRRRVLLAATACPRSSWDAAAQRALFASTAVSRSGGSSFDPPTGWLWGVPPGEKPEEEGWEKIFYWGFGGSFAVAAIAYAYKPDTSIQTWALEEARRRLEAEGILPDPEAGSDASKIL